MTYEEILKKVQPECMKCYYLIRPIKSKLYGYRCHTRNCPAVMLDEYWKEKNDEYEKLHQDKPEYYP